MKNLIVLISIISNSAFAAEKCEILYQDNTIELCGKINPEFNVYNKRVFSIYGSIKGKPSIHLISDAIDLEAVKGTKALKNGLYFYKAYMGGNSVNAENRHILVISRPDGIYNAGEFSDIDINLPGKPKFFTYVPLILGKSHVMDKYERKELVLKGNKLVLKDTNGGR